MDTKTPSPTDNLRSDAVNVRPLFRYSVVLHATIEGREYEMHKELETNTQFRAGDKVNIDGLDEVTVEDVVWTFDKPGEAFMELEDVNCDGTVAEWIELAAQFDCVIPDLSV